VLAPSRELARQLQHQIASLGRQLGVRSHALIGGASVSGDIRALRRGQHVLVGNAGRVYDMISKRHLRVEGLKLLLVDEADAMLSGPTRDQVHDIFRCLPPTIQCGLFSTLMPRDVLDTAGQFMREPVCLLGDGECGRMPGHLLHFYAVVDGPAKLAAVRRFWGDIVRRGSAVVFCGSRRAVDELLEQLNAWRPGSVLGLHAELDQKERQRVVGEFRVGKAKVLVCTQDLARGLDVPRVSMVVNFDPPAGPGDFLLRAGRCGRRGRPGATLSLLRRGELGAMRALAELHGGRLEAASPEQLRAALPARPAREDAGRAPPGPAGAAAGA